MRFTRALVILFLLSATASAQSPFDTHLEGLRVLYETEVARANAAVSEAAAATAALAVAQGQIATLQSQVATLQDQVATLTSQVAMLTQQLADCQNQNPPPTSQDVSIWANTDTPAVIDFADPGAYEIGVKFRSSVAGQVKGVRFYKSNGNVGTHVGHLWAATGGAALATVTFTSETATGWQQMLFSSPVSITAGTLYIASVHMPSGHYSANTQYFTAARVSGVLTAVASSESQNGCFKSGTSGFPATGSSSNANYWVDVVFNGGTAGPPTPPTHFLWDRPTTNSNGTPCTDLGGFRVAWGSVPGSYGPPSDVGNVTAIPLSAFGSGTRYVVALSYDLTGNISTWTPPLEVTVP